MTEAQLKETVLRILQNIAPEVDLTTLKPNVEFHDQIEFDSIDFLNFAQALRKELQVDIPETDYPQLGTLQNGVAYLKARLEIKS